MENIRPDFVRLRGNVENRPRIRVSGGLPVDPVKLQPDAYRHLLDQISDTYTHGGVRDVQTVNTQLVETYWQVGRHIVEFEQGGNLRAEYGKALSTNFQPTSDASTARASVAAISYTCGCLPPLPNKCDAIALIELVALSRTAQAR